MTKDSNIDNIVYQLMGKPVSPVIACFNNSWIVYDALKGLYNNQIHSGVMDSYKHDTRYKTK